MEIKIKSIPHKNHRYETCGDYWYDEYGVLQIRVSEMQSELYMRLVIIHELIEETLTMCAGIPEQEITDFDVEYEYKRAKGLVPEFSEPGFDISAPYVKEHTASTGLEMILASMMHVDWIAYEKTILSL